MTAYSTIYVDLDSLFDMRLATLYALDGESVAPLLTEGYFSRDYDEFKGFDMEAYRTAYATRDARTLSNAVITGVPEIIRFFTSQTLKARASTPFITQPRLHLNIYPYKLPDSAIQALIAGLRVVTNNLIDIEIINLSIDEITPAYVKDHYAMMVMYEYWNWLEVQANLKNFDKTFCPEVTLIGPAIVRSSDAWEQVKSVDIYPMIEQYSSMFIKLILYPVTVFCVDIERKAKTAEKQTTGT